jgi:hypothetical protein
VEFSVIRDASLNARRNDIEPAPKSFRDFPVRRISRFCDPERFPIQRRAEPRDENARAVGASNSARAYTPLFGA